MSRRPVRVIGGPLDGGVYELPGEPGAPINLNTAAGVCIYQFEEDGTLTYVGPATINRPNRSHLTE